MSARARNRWRAGALLVLSGCIIDGVVVDVQRQGVTTPDAAPDEPRGGDGGALDAAADPLKDADGPDDAPSDAGSPPGPTDGGHDAGGDAGRDAAAPSDAGDGQDAGCAGGRCDGGGPGGPCAMCDVTTLIATLCDNGLPQVCWTNPGGTCSMQCPELLCSREDPDACGAARYCYFPNNDCGSNAPGGYCAALPELEDVTIEVCGCDGVKYRNPSYARAAGVDYSLRDKSCL